MPFKLEVATAPTKVSFTAVEDELTTPVEKMGEPMLDEVALALE